MEFDSNVIRQWMEQDQVAVVIFSVWLVASICYYLGLWNTFKKMGMAGWKCLIPVYSNWIVYKIVWSGGAFWIQVLFGFMAGGVLETDIPYKEYICLVAIAVSALIGLVFLYKLSKAFGFGILFTLGLVVCPVIFFMILGLGSSKFQLFGSRKLRMSTITLGGKEYPIHDFDRINTLQRNDKKAAAVVELSKLTGLGYEEAAAVLDKWHMYYY